MKAIKLTPLINLQSDIELQSGTRLRHINVGMNVPKNEDFYDYILAYASWDSHSMMLVNITENNIKAGLVYGGTVNTAGSASVNKEALKHTLGDELKDWYILE